MAVEQQENIIVLILNNFFFFQCFFSFFRMERFWGIAIEDRVKSIQEREKISPFELILKIEKKV